MNSNDTAHTALERRLAALDPEIPPGRDLWLDIEAAIGASDRRDVDRGDVSLERAPVEVEPRAEPPREELPRTELPRTELPLAELPRAELPRAELPRTELPRAVPASARIPSPLAPPPRPNARSRILAARSWPLALAAGFAMVATVGALVGWQLARLRPPSVASLPTLAPPALTAPGQGRESGGFEVPETQDFVATRTSLQRTYAQRLALLAPATRTRLERDMATIQAANADIRRALAADPQSAVLNHLLASTLQQEFDLYATVIRNTAPAVTRNPS